MFTSYGDKCNSRFLINYGFQEEKDNLEHNMFYLFVNLSKLDHYRMFDRKIKFLDDYKYLQSNPTFVFGMDFKDMDVNRTLGFMRFFAVDNEADWKAISLNFQDYWTQVRFISIHNETRALLLLKELVNDKLEDYNKTYIQDEIKKIYDDNIIIITR